MVRKEIAKLKKSGLVESKEGKSGGSKIAKSPKKISMSQIFQAVRDEEGHILTMYKNDPHPKCTIGSQLQDKLTGLYAEIDKQVLNKLDEVSLHDFHSQFT